MFDIIQAVSESGACMIAVLHATRRPYDGTTDSSLFPERGGVCWRSVTAATMREAHGSDDGAILIIMSGRM